MNQTPPALTDLQFAALTALRSGERPGKEVLSYLEHKVRWRATLPQFSNLMARLRRLGFVRRDRRQSVQSGFRFRESFYQITAEGNRAWLHKAELIQRLVDHGGGGLITP